MLFGINLVLNSIVLLIALRLWTGIVTISDNKTISYIVRILSGVILLMNLFEIIKIVSATS